MRHDSRLPRVLHVLLHLDGMQGPATSELIADMLQTNASVVRRILSGLREAGILSSIKGHGGGWALAKRVEDVSMLDIYTALGAPTLFAIGKDDLEPSCALARAANAATTEALSAARVHFEQRLQAVSVADIIGSRRAASVNCRRFQEGGTSGAD